VVGYEAAVVATLQARSIKHIFLYSTGLTSSQYVQYATFVQTAHGSGMTVHPVVCTQTTVTSGGSLSSSLLSNLLQQVVMYNNSTNPASRFDGMQIDIEGVTGPTLLACVQGVTVPYPLVFSAAVQPDEFNSVESSYSNLLATTSLDVLIPMIYIMDDLDYSGGNLTTNGFSITGADSISYKTTEILAKTRSTGQIMTSLSAYDYEFAVIKGGGEDSSVPGNGDSEIAFSNGTYAVPHLAATYSLVSVTYQPIIGVSTYRFNYSSTDWFDVDEMTPVGLGLSIAAANNAGTNSSYSSNYVGTCTFVYHTVFDSTSERQQGLTMNDTNYPSPQVNLQVLSVVGNTVQLQVSLTNGNPSEQILGDSDSAGVHLQLPPGASFVSAGPGSFHAAMAFNSSGSQLANINGAQVLELRRYFFENLAAQGAQSGIIQVTAIAPFALQYRAWMTAKTSIYNNNGSVAPYITRSPSDVPYNNPSNVYNMFTTNVAVASSSAYEAAVAADQPMCYLRFSETNVVSVPNPFIVSNLGTMGLAGNGMAAATNYGVSTSILGGQPGALASSTNTALGFIGDTNRIIVPYNSEWNLSAPFSVELWLKGGTALSCPAASCDWTNDLGWLVYQGNLAQTSGDGWYFRLYKAGTNKVQAQIDMTVSTNLWYYIAGVYDGTNVMLYTNGVLAVSTPLSGTYAPNTTYPLTFGARPDSGSLPYGGFIDEPAFYTNALTASQIAAHYTAATTNAAGYAAQILAGNPAGYWPFNDPMNPPLAVNSGTGGSAFNGAYLNWSATVPDFEAPAYPGLETTNSVLELFGTNGQVLLPPLNLNTNTVTFECWLKRNGNQTAYAGLLMHRNSNGLGACGLGFHAASNHLGYWWNDAVNTYNWDSGLLPPNGLWTYAALTISPSQAVISMCDGTTWSTATNTVTHTNQAFAGLTRVGSDGALAGHWFNGSLDEAAIYHTALTQTQLRTHALSAFGNTNQPLFTLLPLSRTVYAGTNVSFNPQVAGAPTINYQWTLNGTNLAGATGLSLSFASVDYTNAGQYALAATNTYGGVLSPAATLTVLPPLWITNLTYRIMGAGSGAGYSLELIWPAGTLYSATNLAGPWTVVGGATLPYYELPLDPATPSLFFKAR
jgi:hypothetical protein